MAKVRDAFRYVLSAVAVSDSKVLESVCRAYAQPSSSIRLTQTQANAIMEILKQHCTPGTTSGVQSAMDELVKHDRGGLAPSVIGIANAVNDTWLRATVERQIQAERERLRSAAPEAGARARARLSASSHRDDGPSAPRTSSTRGGSQTASRAAAAAAVDPSEPRRSSRSVPIEPSLPSSHTLEDCPAGCVRYGDEILLRCLSGGCRHIALLGSSDIGAADADPLADVSSGAGGVSLAAFLLGADPDGMDNAEASALPASKWSETVTAEGYGLGREGEIWKVVSGAHDSATDESDSEDRLSGSGVPSGAPIALRSVTSGRLLGVDPVHMVLRARAGTASESELFQLCTPSLLTRATLQQKGVAMQGADAEADAVLSAIAHSLGGSHIGPPARSSAPIATFADRDEALEPVPYSAPLLLRSVQTGLFVAVAAGEGDESPTLADLSTPPISGASHTASSSAAAGTTATTTTGSDALARSGLRPGAGSGASAFGLGLDGDGPQLLRSPRKASARPDSSARGGSLSTSALLPVHAAFRFAIVPSGSTYLPAWTLSRPFLSGSYMLAGPAIVAQASSTSTTPGVKSRHSAASSAVEAVRELGFFTTEQQEAMLASDLIDAFLGHSGRYVMAASRTELKKQDALGRGSSREGGAASGAALAAVTGEGLSDLEFRLVQTRGADPALIGLARQLLPAAAHAARCRRFIEMQSRPEAGLTAQALADAFRKLLHELGLLLAQIESQALTALPASRVGGQSSTRHQHSSVHTGQSAAAGAASHDAIGSHDSAESMPPLQLLTFYLGPAIATLRALHSVVQAAGDARGGALLDCVAAVDSRAGDRVTSQLCKFLLQTASSPFLRQVEAWVFRGELVDDHGLFMVRVAQTAKPGHAAATTATTSSATSGVVSAVTASGSITANGDVEFELHHEQIPSFLRKHAQHILAAGRNLASLRRCAADVTVPADAAAAATDLASLATGSPADGGETLGDDASESRALAALHRAGPAAMALAAARGRDATSSASDESVASSGGAHLEFSSEPRAYEALLRGAHSRAARALLRHLVDRSKLHEWLHSMRRYFLLAQGDFVGSFMDSAEEELGRLADPKAGLSLSLAAKGGREYVSLQRLRSLLELSLRVSSASAVSADKDPARERLTCRLEGQRLISRLEDVHLAAQAATSAPHHQGRRRRRREGELRGHDAVVLDVVVPWPVSLVVSGESLDKYQMLFRHIFACKHVERKLSQAWTALQACKELSLRRELAMAHTLRARMHHFVRNLVYYMTVEAIEPRWREMLAAVSDCSTVDEVAGAHSGFLDTCLKECLLTSFDVLKSLERLIALCSLFADRFVRDIDAHKPSEEEVAKLAGEETPMAARRRRDGAIAHRARGGVATAMRGMHFVPADDEEKRDQLAVKRSRDQHRRRAARIAAQSESMRHTMGQEGWQDVILRASDMFDKQLEQFMTRLDRIASKEYKSHLIHLVTRLDFNGFYSAKMAAVKAAAVRAAASSA